MVDILVVEDRCSFADALVAAFEAHEDINPVGRVASAEEALERIAGACPDVVLIDLDLPGMNGIDAIAPLRACCPDVRIILLSSATTGMRLLDAADAGANAFLPRDVPVEEIAELLVDEPAGFVADQSALARMLEHAGPGGHAVLVRRGDLTDREYQVLLLLADGCAVPQIAERLAISPHTCRGHVRSLLRKLDAHSQLAAVVAAARAGLLPNLRAC